MSIVGFNSDNPRFERRANMQALALTEKTNTIKVTSAVGRNCKSLYPCDETTDRFEELRLRHQFLTYNATVESFGSDSFRI